MTTREEIIGKVSKILAENIRYWEGRRYEGSRNQALSLGDVADQIADEIMKAPEFERKERPHCTCKTGEFGHASWCELEIYWKEGGK